MENFKVPRERPRLLSPVIDEIGNFDHGEDRVEDKEMQSIKRLQNILDQELEKVKNTSDSDHQSRKKRFLVHKQVLGHLLEHVTSYKDILAIIKAQYENVIDHLEQEKEEAILSASKLKSLTYTQATLGNYYKREAELKKKLDYIEADNKRLRAAMEEETKKRNDIIRKDREMRTINKKVVTKLEKNFLGYAPGISKKDADNVKALRQELDKCESDIQEIKDTENIKFASKEIQATLKKQWATKEDNYRGIVDDHQQLAIKGHMYKVASEALQTCLLQSGSNESLIDFESTLKVLKNVIESYHGTYDLQMAKSNLFDEDDPTKEKEAEIILEYIEAFNVLFQDKHYEQAAIHAANSPRGVLRTTQTLNRFKEAKKQASCRSPLLAYCEAIMSSAEAVSHRPTVNDSIEYINCALTEGRDDLVVHWIAQGQLTLSEVMGDIILSFSNNETDLKKYTMYVTLAQSIYSQCECHKKVTHCYHQRGLYQNLLAYCQEVNYTIKDFTQLLSEFPVFEVSKLLCRRESNSFAPLSVHQVVNLLHDLNKWDVIENLLQFIYDETNSNLLPLVIQEISVTQRQWQQVIHIAANLGLHEIALELHAAVLTRLTLNSLNQ
ncbi:Clathrin heavy chain linker domain-containing protein 1 [Trichoplax sp. H2]|nr:Clathrin heavy chain linker domain-containing protein 1 [Trichoplax sp. H2]|eukprot:RDD36862.1 Clathrin heavy chain linker domain-containing protein 1 [Trichoplax sp. H2]